MSHTRVLAIALVGILAVPAAAQSPSARPDAAALAEAGTRQVHVTPFSIVPLRTHLRFSTLIVLPSDERILEVHTGDKEFWQVSVPAPTEHTVSVKPSKSGASTNIDLFCASGNVYSFTLTEVSAQPKATPDLKVFVDADETMRGARAAPKYVAADELTQCQARMALVMSEAQATVDRAIADYPTSLRFDYRVDRRGPLWIEAVWRDERRTYLRTRANELPALYEISDGKPSLVQFEVRGHTPGAQTLVVPKVLDAGYLALGSKRAEFRREAR